MEVSSNLQRCCSCLSIAGRSCFNSTQFEVLGKESGIQGIIQSNIRNDSFKYKELLSLILRRNQSNRKWNKGQFKQLMKIVYWQNEMRQLGIKTKQSRILIDYSCKTWMDCKDFRDISKVWQDQNEDIKMMSEPVAQIQFGFDKEERCLSTQFKVLCFMTQTQHHVEKLYKNPQQFQYNRNANFMTFDPSRVTLGSHHDREKAENYINANFINIEGKQVIATQGPLTVAFYNFWRMIEQYQITKVFMLCNLIEKNKIKCDRYFPDESKKIVEKEYQVQLLEDTTYNGKEVTKKTPLRVRKFLLKNNQTNKELILTHYQLLDWDDGDRPKKKSSRRIKFLLAEFTNCFHNGSIPLVHCSAGVGRTGTFIAMGLLKLVIENNQNLSISVFDEVRKLKEQRWGMVYTLSQYEYLYEFVEKQINRKNNSKMVSESQNSSQEMADS